MFLFFNFSHNDFKYRIYIRILLVHLKSSPIPALLGREESHVHLWWLETGFLARVLALNLFLKHRLCFGVGLISLDAKKIKHLFLCLNRV